VCEETDAAAWLQSMTPEAIRAGFEHPVPSKKCSRWPMPRLRVRKAMAVGINATRALTSFNSRSGGFQDRRRSVQTPRLRSWRVAEGKNPLLQAAFVFRGSRGLGEAGSYRGRWFDENFKSDGDEDAACRRLWSARKRPQSKRNGRQNG